MSTTTLAARIRTAADARGYWLLENHGEQRSIRSDIVRELGCTAQAVRDALRRGAAMGRPRNPKLARCPTCGHALVVVAHARDAPGEHETPAE